mmetsp:Transcript_17816/g.29471  ORF Transcript_17816/g.29471 Transcript_17816/m.29471 type:complete len:202 (+) Transcript_17816:119-724(+)|eukprot:CAMPEP_0119010522 /NCGR_PEP_ID=MMETSP1176-20130426/5071_1 /TAXON_ID=265551 /ORGANISM="Synedropsis recta cf, Strain CCMP1620" /LENGTH=201 /DNA_ID=CAMNT_0006963197 /DNA_START=94 /DNA_END=699 /DNA_ORIENTATION=-
MPDTPLYVSDPEKWIHQIGHDHDVLCLVIFRGAWCSFDKHYLELLGPTKPEGCYMVAWTSQGEDAAKEAQEQWNIKDFDLVIGDKTAALAKYLVDDVILPKLDVNPPRMAVKSTYNLGDDDYPEGLVQPGMAIFAHKGNLCMQWEAEVNEANLYGAANRPDPKALWAEVAHRRTALDQGSSVMPIHGSRLKMCTKCDDIGK